MNPYNAGWDAQDKGEVIDDNPYCYGMPEFEQWISGWNDSYTHERESEWDYNYTLDGLFPHDPES